MISPSETPRTDEDRDQCRTCGIEFVPVSTSEKLERDLSTLQRQPHIEFAFVIRKSFDGNYWAGKGRGGDNEWSKDDSHAVRFCRHIDAVSCLPFNELTTIEKHSWMPLSEPPQESEGNKPC